MTGEQAFTAGDVPCNINFDAWVGERLQLRDFIRRTVRLCRPRNVHICNGSDTEYRQVRSREIPPTVGWWVSMVVLIIGAVGGHVCTWDR